MSARPRSRGRARAAPRRAGPGPRGPAVRSARPAPPGSPRGRRFGRPTLTRPRGVAASSRGARRASRRSRRRRRRAGPRLRGRRLGERAVEVDASSCQLLSQSLDSLVDAATRRLRRAAERGGDLGVRQVAGVAQGHRGALLRRQRADDGPDAVVGLAVADRDLGAASATGSGRRPLARWWSIALRWAIVSSQPRRLLASLELRVGAQRREEGLLKAVLGVAAGRRRRAGPPSRRRRARRAGSGTAVGRSLTGLNAPQAREDVRPL